jgi:hypothetical protein
VTGYFATDLEKQRIHRVSIPWADEPPRVPRRRPDWPPYEPRLVRVPVALCDPPHRVARPEQVVELANAFARAGWGRGEPALVGYPLEGRVQLLSGSHRYAAAKMAHLDFLPVAFWSLHAIEKAFGDLWEWGTIMDSGAWGARYIDTSELTITCPHA